MKRPLRHLVRSLFPQSDIERAKGRSNSFFHALDALESRVFLSGTVMASVVQGNLKIWGDAAANVVALDQTGLSTGQVRISGDSGTSINNQTDPVVLSGITSGTYMALGEGADSLTMSGLTLPGALLINAAGGANTLSLNNVEVAGTLFIEHGASPAGTSTQITNTTVGAHLSVVAGTGPQDVLLRSVEVQGNLGILTGKGPNRVQVDDSTFHSEVRINTGGGADSIQIESNGDPLGVPTQFDGLVWIASGAAADTLRVGVPNQSGNRSVFARGVYLNGRAGYDTLQNFNTSTFINQARVRIVSFEANTSISDTIAPTVSSTAPANNSTGIALNQKIAATFSEAMDPATITVASVTLTGPSAGNVSGTVSYAGTTMTFTPDSALAANTAFTATISTGAKDLAGNSLASDKVWTFTTGATSDTTAPTVSSTDPASGASGVALNKKIAVTFSEAMDPLTITSANVTVTAPGGVSVAGAVGFAGTTMTFTPSATLAPNTMFSVAITTGVKDLAGNALASNFASSFTTGATADLTAPTVISTDPAGNATGVALNKKIAATFSEAMDPATITTVNVTVSASGSVAVSGAVDYVGTTMKFTPDLTLAPNTTFIVTITTGAKDLAGNPLASNFVWTFTTGANPDTVAPTVTSTDPANNATGVALNKKIAATFSEAMDPLTITTANVALTSPGPVSVSGSVAYVGTTLTFTPNSLLAPNTTFTATIGTGVKDLAGNSLASAKVWTFTTGATPDTTAPTVTSTNPANVQTNVPINKTVAATFSESMDPLTIPGNFRTTGPGNTPVSGTMIYDAPSKTVTFTPSSNLATNTLFTATITGGVNGVKDLAGNALVSDKVWTFTTGTQIAQAPINLGRAGAFAVMATASINGSGNQIQGDVGLNPGSAQGIPPSEVNGTIHVNDQSIIDAQTDLLAAYNDAVGRSVTSVSLPGNMGGLTFTPGLYTNSTSVLIQGAGPANNVTLDAQGDPNAIFIFQMGSTLTTGPGAQVILAGGAKASNVFWQVGTSATLDTTTIFKGNILAAVTITVNNGSAVEGRLLGGSNSNGSVTVNASSVTVPAP